MLTIGLCQTAGDGRPVHCHEQNSPAPQEVWPGPAGEDQVPLRRSPRPMEQPQDQGLPGQAETWTKNPGRISQYHKGRLKLE